MSLLNSKEREAQEAIERALDLVNNGAASSPRVVVLLQNAITALTGRGTRQVFLSASLWWPHGWQWWYLGAALAALLALQVWARR